MYLLDEIAVCMMIMNSLNSPTVLSYRKKTVRSYMWFFFVPVIYYQHVNRNMNDLKIKVFNKHSQNITHQKSQGNNIKYKKAVDIF